MNVQANPTRNIVPNYESILPMDNVDLGISTLISSYLYSHEQEPYAIASERWRNLLSNRYIQEMSSLVHLLATEVLPTASLPTADPREPYYVLRFKAAQIKKLIVECFQRGNEPLRSDRQDLPNRDLLSSFSQRITDTTTSKGQLLLIVAKILLKDEPEFALLCSDHARGRLFRIIYSFKNLEKAAHLALRLNHKTYFKHLLMSSCEDHQVQYFQELLKSIPPNTPLSTEAQAFVYEAHAIMGHIDLLLQARQEDLCGGEPIVKCYLMMGELDKAIETLNLLQHPPRKLLKIVFDECMEQRKLDQADTVLKKFLKTDFRDEEDYFKALARLTRASIEEAQGGIRLAYALVNRNRELVEKIKALPINDHTTVPLLIDFLASQYKNERNFDVIKQVANDNFYSEEQRLRFLIKMRIVQGNMDGAIALTVGQRSGYVFWDIIDELIKQKDYGKLLTIGSRHCKMHNIFSSCMECDDIANFVLLMNNASFSDGHKHDYLATFLKKLLNNNKVEKAIELIDGINPEYGAFKLISYKHIIFDCLSKGLINKAQELLKHIPGNETKAHNALNVEFAYYFLTHGRLEEFALFTESLDEANRKKTLLICEISQGNLNKVVEFLELVTDQSERIEITARILNRYLTKGWKEEAAHLCDLFNIRYGDLEIDDRNRLSDETILFLRMRDVRDDDFSRAEFVYTYTTDQILEKHGPTEGMRLLQPYLTILWVQKGLIDHLRKLCIHNKYDDATQLAQLISHAPCKALALQLIDRMKNPRELPNPTSQQKIHFLRRIMQRIVLRVLALFAALKAFFLRLFHRKVPA